MTPAPSGLSAWTAFLGEREIPVLRQTARALTDARLQADRISVRAIDAIILQDPLMTARVLRFSARHRGRRQLQEISTIEHAVMMLGVEPFFHHFAQFDVIEDLLKPHPQALLGALHVVQRAQRAARFALDWATWRCDLSCEEVAISALLHDLAELLVWCFAPQQAWQAASLPKARPDMRSAEAQQAVIGFTYAELQTALCQAWGLPALMLAVQDEQQRDRPRAKNVRLAADLARHTAKGWDDPAVPDDLKAVAALMNIDEPTLRLRLGIK